MGRTAALAATGLIAAVVCLAGAQADVDAPFARFWSAKDPSAAAKAANDIIKAGISVDDAFARLQRGRTYSKAVATGIVEGRRSAGGRTFRYRLDVPASYDPSKAWQVRIQLHGGVNRSLDAPRRGGGNGIGRLAGAEQIYILPEGWDEAPWWSDLQVENIRAILDIVKRAYNVNENLVALSGVSDGGTGAYYVAMRDPTPYASILPLNGSLIVLRGVGMVGDLFPTNLRNRPFFVVNGGRDPLYPAAGLEPMLAHLHDGGVTMEYHPQPTAGHDTSWWLQERDAFEKFVTGHSRVALPDQITWETSDTRESGRVHWLVIESLRAPAKQDPHLPDLNDFAPPALDFGVRMSGLRVERVSGRSSADRIGLSAGDTIVRVDDQAISTNVDLVNVLGSHAVGTAIRFTVSRGGREVMLSGLFDPAPLQPETTAIFTHRNRSGRIDLRRRGNVVDVQARGVDAFTLLLSPAQFDLSKPVTVTVNGRTAFESLVKPDLATLMKWAARDNDRTMLFGAEIRIVVR
jgi:poly(3-hydroxybutyrate) depolymerase